ncbi:MAG: DUF3868 domain-containing protein [Dysgonomonas sp.]
MMNKISNTWIVILLSVLTLPILAQQTNERQINITSGEIKHEGDSLYVDMVVDLNSISLDRNRSLTLTPIVTDGKESVILPDILINGATRHKAYLRSKALNINHPTEDGVYAVIKLDKYNKDPLHYRQAIPFDSWMSAAYVNLNEDLCGCIGYRELLTQERVISRMPPREKVIYEITPRPAYIKPEAEMTKTRNEQWETYLDFPINKSAILPNYMGNNEKLANIEQMLSTVESDKNLNISHIRIIGFASPEGSISHNETLSKSRAEAFKNYLASKLDFPSNAYSVEYGGENWNGLIDAIKSSSTEDKDEILAIINNTEDVNQRKMKLKLFKNGTPYFEMLNTIYPKLRKVVSEAQYIVKGFDIEEAKEIIKTRPQQLSLDEIYNVANTYPVGSESFIEIFETAVRMYPSDNVANLNAAAAALSIKNIKLAEKYLRQADPNSPEFANNTGVLYLLKGDTENAKLQFEKAQNGGSEAAKYNLQEINKKQEIEARNEL